MKNSFLLAGLCFCLALESGDLKAAAVDQTGCFFDVWQEQNGVDLSSITAIVQSHDGYLWLGTYDGLVRFDGLRFTVFNPHNTPGLKDGLITALFEDSEGVLWIGHETGELTRMRGPEFAVVSLGPAWPGGGPIITIGTDENRDLWLLNDHGSIFRMRDGLCVTGAGEEISGVAWMKPERGKNGSLWIVFNGAVGRMKGGRFEAGGPGEIGEGTDFHAQVLPGRDGGLWVVRNHLIEKWRDGRRQVALENRSQDVVTTLLETRSGSLLAGTMKDGLYCFTPGVEPLHFTRTNGLSDDWVRSLCEDSEGNVWIGTGGGGLEALRDRRIQMLNAPDGWHGHSIKCFTKSRDGTVWIGTEGAGLYAYHNGEWTSYGETNGLTSPYVWSVLETRRNELLVGTWGGGLFLKNGDRFISPGDLGKVTAPVMALYEGHQGEVWIGTTIGLYRYEGGKLIWFAGKEKLAMPDVRTIAESPDGGLWFGMVGGGLGCLREGKLRQFRKQDGLNSDYVSGLYADADGTLWIGTLDNGLGRWREGRFASIGLDQGLPRTALYHIVDDGAGSLWLDTQSGILRATKAAIQRCADGTTKSLNYTSYGKAEGWAIPQQVTCKLTDGQLWFPTRKGLAIVEPANLSTNSQPPPVLIEELIVDGEAVEQVSLRSAVDGTGVVSESVHGRPLRLPPGTRRLEFRYTGLDFTAPDKVRFKYKLAGLEDDWVDAGDRHSVQYNYLPPGAYHFHVIACNHQDVWNERGASLTFTVLPYFWQKWWFRGLEYLGGAAGVGGVAFLVSRRRHRRLVEHLERQHALEHERARVAKDIHDNLGASLTQIMMLSQPAASEIEQPKLAAALLDRIYLTARETTRAMDEIVWAINPKHDSLDGLATYLHGFVEAFAGSAGLHCRLDVPVQLPACPLDAEKRHNLFLAFKEALHNVVKHSGASEVKVSLTVQTAAILLKVEDNGCGFPASNTPPERRKGGRLSGGNGLENMRRRMEGIGGHCEIQSAPGQGTKVTFVTPTGSRDQR